MNRTPEQVYFALRTTINLPPHTPSREPSLVTLRREARELCDLPDNIRMPDGVLADYLRRKIFSENRIANEYVVEKQRDTPTYVFGDEYEELFKI